MKNRTKLRNKSRQQIKKERVKVFKTINGKGGRGDFIALLLEHGEICLIDSELKYIGSYHYLKIHNILDIVCNESHQFMAILADDNSLEVVNIYTQNILFTVIIQDHDKIRKSHHKS